ncbi:MAG: response regulator transcription factor [Clostridia bacterium]|nr:response regulator transcription factor [Clostridia bacterium]
MKKILVCEDEVSIRSFVVVNLRREGYEVVEAGSGEEALSCYAADPTIAMALLDVMLPGIDGFETCRRLREQSRDMGIIMLTARTREEEKVSGLRMGADDYVTKPFSTAELLARVDALYRRLETKEPAGYIEQIVSGEFALDLRTRRLLRQDVSIELTQVEFQILELFFGNPDTLLTRGEILRHVWGTDMGGDEKIVDVNIRRLRMKVEADPSEPRHLLTVWGRGYQWNA